VLRSRADGRGQSLVRSSQSWESAICAAGASGDTHCMSPLVPLVATAHLGPSDGGHGFEPPQPATKPTKTRAASVRILSYYDAAMSFVDSESE